jgi:hypothetical protein
MRVKLQGTKTQKQHAQMVSMTMVMAPPIVTTVIVILTRPIVPVAISAKTTMMTKTVTQKTGVIAMMPMGRLIQMPQR